MFRRPWVWAVVAISGGVVLYLLFSRYGLLARWQVEQRYREQQRRYNELSRRADSLRLQILQFQQGYGAIERIAREHYGMMRPGETLYVIPEKP
ncbi:MAG: septum formation initiator family protein [Candidatus Kapabacteria bacterium]|nr:septum formation initiator family protein [Candidatus Kapabacteria bacterium]MDW7997600.1 septum formation initiator family protein [Bacteroidota bacterium]MDW8224736.1 septum formation initiator family protein [Bacteroidota bacterium]